MFKGTALITRPGSEKRLGEIKDIENFIKKQIGCPIKQI